MTRQLFDDLIGAPPASTVDIERIIVRQERVRRRRRWLVACGAVAGIAVIVATGRYAPALPSAPAAERSPVVLAQYGDFTAWLDGEIPAAVPRLGWTAPGQRAYSAHDGEPAPDGFSYRRPFDVDGWRGSVEVYVVPAVTTRPDPPAICAGIHQRQECAPVDSGRPGVACVVFDALEIACGVDGAAYWPELRIAIADTAVPFELGLLVPVVARLATALPPGR